MYEVLPNPILFYIVYGKQDLNHKFHFVFEQFSAISEAVIISKPKAHCDSNSAHFIDSCK